MGSDGKMKSEAALVEIGGGCRIPRRTVLTCVMGCLMAAALVLRATVMPKVLSNVSSNRIETWVAPYTAPAEKATSTEAPEPIRPASDAHEYDQYFMGLAAKFSVGSDFDITNALRKQGFRGTRGQVVDFQKHKLIRSHTDVVLQSHSEWTHAKWSSLKVTPVPTIFQGTLAHHTEGVVTPFPVTDSHDQLRAQLDSMVADRTFFMEMNAVFLDTGVPVPVSEKVMFSYTNKTWNTDDLSTSKFIGLIDLFTSRKLHGAHTKELNSHQTAVRPLMADDVTLAHLGMVYSLAMMPKITAPKSVQEKCAKSTENLDFPVELKVLVVWGKAYMAACFNPICNPFAGDAWIHSKSLNSEGPRYTVFPEGKSMFYGQANFSADAKECASAVDEFVQARLGSAMAAAERIAANLGAPWLRVDLFMDGSATAEQEGQGILVHRVRTLASSVSPWTKRSERIMQIIARGFESRGRLPMGSVPKTVQSKDRLKELGCRVEEEHGVMHPVCTGDVASAEAVAAPEGASAVSMSGSESAASPAT